MGLFNWFKPPPPIDSDTRALVERAVTTVEPLLKSVRGHERKLVPAVRHAFEYCRGLAPAIPGPIPITRAAFASEPLVHALFGSADDIADMLGRSQCVRGQLLGMGGADQGPCCALLGMRHRQKSGFGVKMSGEIIRADEPQKMLYFTDHTLAEPSPDLDTAYLRLVDAMFDGLLKGFVSHLAEVRAERAHLRDQQALVRVLANGGGEDDAYTRRQAELSDRLRASADALQAPRLIETLHDYLATPENSLRLEPVKLTVDRAGVIVETPEEQANAETLSFVELTARDKRRWVVMIAHIDREEARAAVARIDAARRRIVI